MNDRGRPLLPLAASQLERAIEAQELLRGQVPDDVIDAAIASMRAAVGERAPDGPAPSQRRFVTVLFADIVGFTSFSEGRDPEVVAATINELWTAVDGEIMKLGGRVDKHMGDAVMGVWGTDQARESDAELAVRSALRIRDRFDEFNRSRGADLGLRVGIGTGYAFFSSIGSSGEWSVTGDTVNTASRMEGAAPPGGILVTDSTRALLGDTFLTEEVAPFALKGKEGLFTAHLVWGLRAPDEERTHARSSADLQPFVGRGLELALLRASFEATCDGPARSVLMHGEAGVGKSALVTRFMSWLGALPDRPLILFGRAMEFAQSLPVSLIRDVVWRHLGIAENDPTAVAFEHVRRAFAEVDGTGAFVAARWLGLDPEGVERPSSFSGTELSATARVHLRRYVERLADVSGVVIVLEDLHWADAESLTALHEIVHAAHARVMVVGTTRSTDQRLETEGGPAQLLSVEPLDPHSSAALLSVTLQHPNVPAELRERIIEIAHGNPLHIGEIVRSILASGWRPGSGHGPTVLDGVEIPTSLAGALQARIDAFGALDRTVLQCAAVIGRRFWDQSLVALLADGTGRRAHEVARSVQELERMHVIVRRERSAFQGCDEYRFKHGLMRNAAYETVLLDDRRRLHSRMVDWLDTRVGDHASEFAGELADHLIGAANRTRAVTVLADAAGRAMAVGALNSALTLFHRALDVRGDAPPDQDMVEVMTQYGCARYLSGSPGDAAAMLENAVRIADDLGLERLAWRASVRHARALMVLGRWDDAAGAISHLSDATVDRDPRDDIELELALGALAEAGQEAGSGLAHVERAVETARCNRLDDELCRALGELGWSLFRLGRVDEARMAVVEALTIARQLGNLERQAVLIMNQAVVSHLLAHDHPSQLDTAVAKYQEATARFDELGSVVGRLRAQGNLAQVEVESGRIEVGAHRALDVLRAAWDAELAIEWSLALLVLAQVELVDGDAELGLEILGALVHDRRVERWDDQIERTLSMAGFDPSQSWPRVREAGKTSADDLVVRLLARRVPTPAVSS